MREFPLEIVTPDGLVYSGTCESVAVKTTEGDVEIMYGHTNYFAALTIGEARIKTGGSVKRASLQGGFISVEDKAVSIVATTFEFADEIDLLRAQEAKRRAEEAVASATEKKNADIAKAKLMRALNRISVSKGK